MAKNSPPRKLHGVLSVTSQAPTAATEDARGRAAYHAAEPAAQALRTKELIAINIDVPTAVTRALRSLPAMLALRDELARDLPNFDLTNLDALETYALATAYAYVTPATPSASPVALAALTEQCLSLGRTLHLDALALANRGLISGIRLPQFKSRMTHKQLTQAYHTAADRRSARAW